MIMSIEIDDTLFQRLTKLAKEKGITDTYNIHEFLKEQVTEFLDEKIADIEDSYTAEKAWLEFESGDRKTYTSDEIRKEFGL